MRGGKYYITVETKKTSPELDRKSPISASSKNKNAKGKIAGRQTKFKSDAWYQKAMLSMKISGEP